MKKNVAILIMAAGASTRMVPVKQSLPWDNETLLEHVYHNCKASKAIKSYVVLGAFADEIKSSWKSDIADVFINPEWQKGLGNSIAAGVRNLLFKHPDINGILIVLGDQPMINSVYLNRLILNWKQQDKDIIATRYGDKNGVPALFHQSRFKALLALDGDRGAQEMLSEASEGIATVDGSAYVADIDTLLDYERLKQKKDRSNS